MLINLVIFQDKGRLHLGNKLNMQHLNYKQNIMKVRLAVQVFSQSVADALTMLAGMPQYPEFRDATQTAAFLKVRKTISGKLIATKTIYAYCVCKLFWVYLVIKLNQAKNPLLIYSFFQNTKLHFSKLNHESWWNNSHLFHRKHLIWIFLYFLIHRSLICCLIYTTVALHGENTPKRHWG